MARFGLIGASGYIAPRHMEAVKNIGGELVTILDPNDSVGVIDRYHPKATYFSEYERFDREVDRLKRMGKGLCTTNTTSWSLIMSNSSEKFKQPNPAPDKDKNRTLNRADGRRLRRYVSQQKGTFIKSIKPFHQLLNGD